MQTQIDSNLRNQSPSTVLSSVARERYQIDTVHASALFKVRHLMVSHVRGELGPVSGELELDPRETFGQDHLQAASGEIVRDHEARHHRQTDAAQRGAAQ